MRLIAVALILTTAAAACDSDDGDGGSVDATDTGAEAPGPVGVLTGDFNQGIVEVTADPDPPVAGAEVRWSFRVSNRSDDPLTLRFSSGQRAEITLTRDGDDVYRWSEGRVFTQALEEVALGPGDETTFELQGGLDVAPGTYELTAELTADPAPSPMRKTIEVQEE